MITSSSHPLSVMSTEQTVWIIQLQSNMEGEKLYLQKQLSRCYQKITPLFYKCLFVQARQPLDRCTGSDEERFDPPPSVE